MKKVKPLYLYLVFVSLILAARFFENKVDTAYYALVILGWISFFLAVRNYFAQRKSRPKTRKR